MIPDPLKHVEDMRNLPLRDDDVVIAAYPKSGTHWLWEVTHMLLHKTTVYERRIKECLMLEATPDLDIFKEEPSPRIFNTHVVMDHYPQEVLTKKTKIIHVIRNPKDVWVSFYYQNKGLDPNLTLQNLLDAVVNDQLVYPSQFDYLRQMSQFQHEHPDHPVLHIYYEEMNRNPKQTIQQLATFLGVEDNEEFLEKVQEACKFDKMKKVEEDNKKELPEALAKVAQAVNMKMVMFRKGIIGDWKNELTKEQIDQMDTYIAKEMEKGLEFKFIYE
ncbi:sulfotransferase 1A1 [Biomphalaria pfeifferi]|uniref:Sulfotransferase 1A1 n=1 Tax=Biomphalaria pfeifferi TaxID=112525 RepID=A0AAD8BJ70_BIOPF|nr:sulfotransferase 1A1 [Biomphalaria pfeifferi]